MQAARQANAAVTLQARPVVPSRFVTIYRGDFTGHAASSNGKMFEYTGCYVNRATFSGSEGSPLSLSLDIIGQSEALVATGNANTNTFCAQSVPTGIPYLFTDDTFTMQSASTSVKEWSITIDNAIQVQFYNSTTATRIFATDRIVTASHTVPYGGFEAAYNQSLADAYGRDHATERRLATRSRSRSPRYKFRPSRHLQA